MSDDGFVRVALEAEIPANGLKALEVAGKPVLLCKSGAKLYACANLCSHASEKLEGGRVGNGWISCPVHGARFDLATGKAKNPPAKEPIEVYASRVVDGWVEIKL